MNEEIQRIQFWIGRFSYHLHSNEEMKIFENPEFGAVRTVEIDGDPRLVGKDVARGLGFTTVATSGNECVRWKRVEKHLESFGIHVSPTSGGRPEYIINGEPWLVGKDVATVLGYSNPRDALFKHVDSDDKGVSQIATPSGVQEMTVINESGLYSLVLSSKLPSPKSCFATEGLD